MNDAGRAEAVFNNLSLKYEGRGFSKQTSPRREAPVFAGRTLEDFDRYYRSRPQYTGYTPPFARAKTAQTKSASAPVKKPLSASANGGNAVKIHSNDRPNHGGAAVAQSPLKKSASVRSIKTDSAILPSEMKKESGMLRRAVKTVVDGEASPVAITRRNFRRLPAATLVTIVACMMSLILLVGSTVITGDISSQYSELKSEVGALASEESKLATELDIKNDLRVIESIAIGKLGMVSRDLIARSYVRLEGDDIIESFEEPEKNVGLSTLLSAIAGN